MILAFLSQIHLQSHHQNVVARVFAEEISTTISSSSPDPLKKIYWQLAYTLLAYPQLRFER